MTSKPTGATFRGMKHIGTTGTDLAVTLDFDDRRSNAAELVGMELNGVELPAKLAKQIWDWFSTRAEADKVVGDAADAGEQVA